MLIVCNLKNCLVAFNSCDQVFGGGAANCSATNCAFLSNRAVDGAALDLGTYVNCTVVDNTSTGNDGQAAAIVTGTLINCIVYGNFTAHAGGPTNYTGSTFSYSDSDPLPSGTGNIDVDPQILTDNIHLAFTSPCIGAGKKQRLCHKIRPIDGQSWNNPPSIGCDEWNPAPVALQPILQVGAPSCRLLSLTAAAAGQPPFAYSWNKRRNPGFTIVISITIRLHQAWSSATLDRTMPGHFN